MKLVDSPVKLSDVSLIEARPASALGEKSEEILKNLLGFSRDRIAALRQKKVI
jgi:crotonobetainyl-CoA:carnitine CoA-transferase CaiB-like acyl-CoA transferase